MVIRLRSASILLFSVFVFTLLASAARSQGVLDSLRGFFYPKSWNCGAATITDNGPGLAYNRYVLKIADVELGVNHDSTYPLCDLPGENLVFGLTVPTPESSQERRRYLEGVKDSELGAMRLGMAVTDEFGQVVFLYEGRLRDEWVWTYGPTTPEHTAFIYWLRSNFTPNKNDSYELRLSMSGVSSGNPIEAQLIALGGGWK